MNRGPDTDRPTAIEFGYILTSSSEVHIVLFHNTAGLTKLQTFLRAHKEIANHVIHTKATFKQ